MLQRLSVRNYAIIRDLSVEPDKELNTITGETGAGKSIIVGALSLILGERADTSVLINKDEKCVVEALFDVSKNETFKKLLKEEELDEEDSCTIRREINAQGKSRAFVNDTPVNLGILNKLTSQLVDLHQQFDHLAIRDDHFQTDVLDAVAKAGKLRKEYETQYFSYRSLQSELESKKRLRSELQKSADYKQFLFEELEQAGFKENEIEEAGQQLKTLGSAERIRQVLDAGYTTLEEGEQPLINELKRLQQQLQSIADVLPDVKMLSDRLQSAHAELKDIAAELENLSGKVSLDPGAMEVLTGRVDLGYKLFKKHGVQSTNELLELEKQLGTELEETTQLDDEILKLEKEADAQYKALLVTAEQLSKQRRSVIKTFTAEVNKLLHLVGMPNALFLVAIETLSQPGILGMDQVMFLLDANKTGQSLPLHKAASGGEMSRIMLAIKSLTAQAMQLPTLIFDEVDTGISGEAAKQVGLLLRDLARYHQVICITHQPQVAARGTKHFFVYKDADGKQQITTKVRVLLPDERIMAIARMIGGEDPGDAAIRHAEEMVAA